MSMITDLIEIENICALGLAVYLADPTLERVIIYDKPCITSGINGKFLEADGKSVYLTWLTIPDPTFYGPHYDDDLRIFDDLIEAAEYNNKIIEKRKKKC